MFVVMLGCILVMPRLVTTVDGNDCGLGWFGSDCNLQCHCQLYPSCEATGACLYHDVCNKFYFGPACQYVDLSTFAGALTNAQYLVDHNDTTCNPYNTTTMARVQLTAEYPLTWFRMVIKYSSYKIDFTVLINGMRGVCEHEHRFWKSNSVDVTCSTTVAMKTLSVEGNIVPNLCSLYISGGRNLALKQPTQQLDDDLMKDSNVSALTVDGATESGPNGACAKLGLQDSNPQWQLIYKDGVRLNYIEIYFTQSPDQSFENFSLQIVDDTDTIISEFAQLTPTSGHVFTASIFDFMPVTSLTISRTNSSTNTSSVVEVCEVETYGEMVCPEHFFGLQCTESCSCGADEHCSPVDGRCSKGCQAGFYGTSCSQRCSQTCLDQICHLSSGNCLACPAGFTGAKCDTVCPAGWFGQDCSRQCSPHCTNNCSSTDGICLCAPGFIFPWCDECQEGLYGPGCNQSCSQNCMDHKCDPDTGNCLQCLPGTAGPQCSECSPDRYGRQCMFNCSRNCASDCDPIHGHCECHARFLEPYCTDCEPGYYGENCDRLCSNLCENKLCDKLTGLCLECGKTRLGRRCEVHRELPPWTNLKPLFIVTFIGFPLLICAGIFWTRPIHTTNRNKRRYSVHRQL